MRHPVVRQRRMNNPNVKAIVDLWQERKQDKLGRRKLEKMRMSWNKIRVPNFGDKISSCKNLQSRKFHITLFRFCDNLILKIFKTFSVLLCYFVEILKLKRNFQNCVSWQEPNFPGSSYWFDFWWGNFINLVTLDLIGDSGSLMR